MGWGCFWAACGWMGCGPEGEVQHLQIDGAQVREGLFWFRLTSNVLWVRGFGVLPQLPQLEGGERTPVAIVDCRDILLVVGSSVVGQSRFGGEGPITLGTSVWGRWYCKTLCSAVRGVWLDSLARIHVSSCC